MVKQDLYTKEQFYTRKRNQKFSSRKNQIAFNNEIKAIESGKIKFIESKLKHNRKILSKILSKKESISVSIEHLKILNFSFTAITHFKNLDSVTYFGVYEYTYRIAKDNTVEIKRNGESIFA